jgi:hypothetical protein
MWSHLTPENIEHGHIKQRPLPLFLSILFTWQITNVTLQMLLYKCYFTNVTLQMILYKCYFTNVTLQMLLYKCYFTIVDIQMLLLQNCKKMLISFPDCSPATFAARAWRTTPATGVTWSACTGRSSPARFAEKISHQSSDSTITNEKFTAFSINIKQTTKIDLQVEKSLLIHRDLRKRLLIKVRTRQSQARSSRHSLLT